MSLDLTRNAKKCVVSPGMLCLFLAWCGPGLQAQSERERDHPLLERLDRGWAEHWREQDVGRGQTEYGVLLDGGEPVLVARSERAASALCRDLDVPRVRDATLRWRWKVAASLSHNRHERERRGDDYAARVFVIFGRGSADLRRSRALCYVWAGNEPVGSAFASPYADNVITIVLESGNDLSGAWIEEQRDVVSDYRASFGEPPDRIAAVVLMVDTDDTASSATGYFADLTLTVASHPAERNN